MPAATARDGATDGRALRLGTRGSALALAQANEVLARLNQIYSDLSTRTCIIQTRGDRDRTAPLALIGGTGVFAKELQVALLDGTIDVAVHSLKDLPPAPVPGLILAAIPPRADARDALVSRGRVELARLPAGARIGTSSARRAALLKELRRDLQVVDIRGNVETRMRSVETGDLDGIVVAAAGLARLGRLDEAAELFSAEILIPAPGQGCLAVETREQDGRARDVAEAIDDPDSHACANAERAFLLFLGAGCTLPVGASARVLGATIELRGMLAAGRDRTVIRRTATGPREDAEALGERIAAELIAEARTLEASEPE